MSNLEQLSFKPSREELERERAQHLIVLESAMPIMPESASRDLQKMHGYLAAREDKSLHDLFLEAIKYRGQFRRGIEAGGPQPNTVANLQIAEEIVQRTKYVTTIARMQQQAEPGEKFALQEEMRASEILPDGEKEFWVFCAETLLEDDGVDWRTIATTAGGVALLA